MENTLSTYLEFLRTQILPLFSNRELAIIIWVAIFLIYALFNKGISNANRIAIIKGVAAEFGVNAPIPATFEGIPLVNNLKRLFIILLQNATIMTSIISGKFLSRHSNWLTLIKEQILFHFVLHIMPQSFRAVFAGIFPWPCTGSVPIPSSIWIPAIAGLY